MHNPDVTIAREIITGGFGGPSKLAAFYDDWSLSTVYDWTNNGIPKWRREAVARAAFRAGKQVLTRLRKAHLDYLDPDGNVRAANIQPDKPETGRARAKQGATRAENKTNKVRPGWSDDALAFVRVYALTHLEFIIEDAKNWAYQNGLDAAHSDGAWGHVPVRAASAGYIMRMEGYAEKSTNPNRHGTPSRSWRSLIYDPNAAESAPTVKE